MRRLLIVCLVVNAVSVLQAVGYRAQLPDTVASHFGGSGRADGWMGRDAFLILNVSVMVCVSALFLGIQAVVPMLALTRSRKRADALSESEKAAIERQDAIRDRMCGSLSSFTFWFGSATMALLVVLFNFAIRANLAPQPVLQHFWPVLGAYAAVAVILTAWLVVEDRRCAREFSLPAPPPGVWFPAKRFGWGWGLPCCWQGWVAILAWLAALAAGIVLIALTGPAEASAVLAWVFILTMVLILLAMCWLKGEKPRWRWGE